VVAELVAASRARPADGSMVKQSLESCVTISQLIVAIININDVHMLCDVS
jgi:hypothetical protein